MPETKPEEAGQERNPRGHAFVSHWSGRLLPPAAESDLDRVSPDRDSICIVEHAPRAVQGLPIDIGSLVAAILEDDGAVRWEVEPAMDGRDPVPWEAN
jgi:hypothetical protein